MKYCIYDVFIRFLKEHNCLNEFKKNALIHNWSYEKDIMRFINPFYCDERLLDSISNAPIELINYAFCWADTHEDDDYWRGLSNQWHRTVNNFLKRKKYSKVTPSITTEYEKN